MTAYVIFDVEIYDLVMYQDFMNQVKPALTGAGAKYLTRGGEHRVYEGGLESKTNRNPGVPITRCLGRFLQRLHLQGAESYSGSVQFGATGRC